MVYDISSPETFESVLKVRSIYIMLQATHHAVILYSGRRKSKQRSEWCKDKRYMILNIRLGGTAQPKTTSCGSLWQ